MSSAEDRSTYLGQTLADEEGGRFKRRIPSTVTGAGPIPQVPHQPATSPWASNPVPDEPPLGIDVHAVPDLGMTLSGRPLLISTPEAGDAPPNHSGRERP